MKVVYHPAVQRDVSRILRHYDGISDRLGDEFWNELNSFINKAAANPQHFHHGSILNVGSNGDNDHLAKHTTELREGSSVAPHFLHTSHKPFCLVIERRPFVELRQVLIPLNDIEAHTELELAQAHRAKVQRAPVALLKVVGTVHQTI